MFKAFVRSSNAMATGSLHGCPASALPGAYAVKGDYLKVVRALVRMIAKGPQAMPQPDLSVLGIESFAGDSALQLNGRTEQVDL